MRFEDLIKKYSSQVPRYTSYPTALQLKTSYSAEDWKKDLSLDAQEKERTLSLYVHIPFCRSLCYFCACTKEIPKTRSVVLPYLSALKKEISAVRSSLSDYRGVAQIHYGGGSPNFLTPEESADLTAHLHSTFGAPLPGAELSVEADPRTTTRPQLEAWAAQGFDRISFGVQDFNPSVQETINRIQTFDETNALVESARSCGFSSINADLIYGLPLQTKESFQETIRQILALRPDRIALYGYAHVTWLKKTQRVFGADDLPSPELRAELFLEARSRLCADGYIFIGMDHFALPKDTLAKGFSAGTVGRNFMGYTTHRGSRVLGFGASAISSLPGALAQNCRDSSGYQKYVLESGFATERGLRRSTDDQLRAELIEELLTYRRLDLSAFASRHGIEAEAYFARELEVLPGFCSDGLISMEKNSIEVTEQGLLFMRNIVSVFDVYLPDHLNSSRPAFSQSI